MSAGQGIGTFLTLAKLGIDDQKARKLKKEAEENEKNRPKLQRDPNADYNLNLTESELSNGMSGRAEAAYNNATDREFSASLGTLLRGGGDINSVGALYGAGEGGRLKLAMMRDNNRLNQIRNVLEQTEKTDQRNYISPFQFNQWAPFADKTKALGEARKVAEDNVEKDWGSFISSTSGMGADSGIGGGGNSGKSGGVSSSSPYETYLGGDQGRSSVREGDYLGGYDYNNLDSGIASIA